MLNVSNEETKKQKIKTNPIRTYADKIADKNHINKTNEIIIDNIQTNIPNNLPTAVIGDKGSGKSTFLKSLIELTYNNNIFKHIYFVYSSLSWDDDLPPYVVKIDVNKCEEFLSMLFEIKTIFISYYKFFKSLDFKELQKLRDKNELTENDFLKHIDNNISRYNNEIINSGINPEEKIDRIIDTGTHIIEKFSKPFYIGSVKIDGLNIYDLDGLFIDDIAIASKVLFKRLKDNQIYEYFTLTRHMRLFICFAGQQIEQIPKMLRREIMCWIISKNTNLELLDGVLQKSTLKKIEQEQDKLIRYQFVIYNTVNGVLSIC